MLVIMVCITGPTNTSFVQPLLFSSEIVCNMTSGILRAEQNLGRPGEQRGHLPNYSKAKVELCRGINCLLPICSSPVFVERDLTLYRLFQISSISLYSCFAYYASLNRFIPQSFTKHLKSRFFSLILHSFFFFSCLFLKTRLLLHIESISRVYYRSSRS